MFIHWGPVALRGTEIGWSRGREVPFEDYDHLYQEFNPMLFDAGEWVRVAKNSGMKYMILVTKHHDGFTLWASEHTDYDISGTPFLRDIVRELSDECRRQGIIFGTYYSILDWYHPDYPLKVNNSMPKEDADMPQYLDFLKNQVEELVHRYQSRILWFDGEWEEPWTHQMGMELYAFVRQLDDSVLINNRVDKGRAGMDGFSKSDRCAGDFETPEQRVGNYNPTTPWETCMTLGEQWAWKPNDKLKSLKDCIHILVQTAGGNGNLLLNVGPMMDGRIEQRQIDLLEKIGAWMKEYGDTIYETRGGPIEPQDWGVSTQKDERIFLHILDNKQTEIQIPWTNGVISSVNYFGNASPVKWRMDDRVLVLEITRSKADEIDTIIEVQCDR